MDNKKNYKSAFTLIELLLVVGIIGILASIVIIAIGPTRMLLQAKDAQRVSEKRELKNAIQQYLIDNGSAPNQASIQSGVANATEICAPNIGSCGNCINMGELAPEYVVAIPKDTSENNPHLSGFSVYKDGSFFEIISDYQGQNNPTDIDFIYDGLIGYWAFDDQTGLSACDYSENEQNATLIGLHPINDWSSNVPPTAFSNTGSINMNGDNNEWITHSTPWPTPAGTISHWIKPNSVSKNMISVYESQGPQIALNGFGSDGTEMRECHLGIRGSTNEFYFVYQDGAGTANIITAGSPVVGEWQHFAV